MLQKNNITSRINTLLINGYKPRGAEEKIIFVDETLNYCVQRLETILKSNKKYHHLALQTIAAIFINLNEKIDKNPKRGALKDIRSALVHYYNFIENKLLETSVKRAQCLDENEANKIREKLESFYNLFGSKWICYTQKEVRDNFKQRLHSQDRLYNHNLLFPISLIVKLLGGPFVSKKWTNKAIDNIRILINKNKNHILFKNVSFFLLTEKNIFVYEKNGKKHTIYTRKYKIVESGCAPMKTFDIERPLQTFAIDHVGPMQKILNDHINKNDVQELKRLSDSFINFIKEKGKEYLKKSWIDSHPSSKGLDILTSKTINDLANGFKKEKLNNSEYEKKEDLVQDLNTLHKNSELELMDTFENKKKGGDL